MASRKKTLGTSRGAAVYAEKTLGLPRVQASIIQIILILALVLFLVTCVVYDSIPKVQLQMRLARQRQNLRKLKE